MTTKTPKTDIESSTKKFVKATSHMPSQLLPERWLLVDVQDKVVGRVATGIAKLLMGKDQATYNQAVAARTNVIIINAEKVKFSGNKMADKTYYHHTGYLGGVRATTPAKILEGKKPTDVITKAVYGMLPKNKLRHVMMDRLRVFAGAEHPHAGQNPVTISL